MLTIRSIVFTGFLFVTAILVTALILLVFWAPYRVPWALAVGWCRMSVRAGDLLCGLKVVVEGWENVPDTPSVIMIKHTTALEAYWQVAIFPRTAWVVKRELFWIPVFGWALKLVMAPIGIDRNAGGSAIKQVIEQGTAKLADGVWVTIFPEGTRVPPGEAGRYGISGAALAQAAGCLIVPVAHNAGDFWPRRGLRKRPGTVRFRIGPPIDASQQSPKETTRLVQNWIETTMLDISAIYKEKQLSDDDEAARPNASSVSLAHIEEH
jgi:1-acyl-sn-glycerol-3-phosphate acyltransferase